MNPYNFPETNGRIDSRTRVWLAWVTMHAERAGNVLVYSSIFQSAIAMAEVAIVMILLSVPPNPAPVVAFLATFAIYTYDRITDIETDTIDKPDQAAFLRPRRDLFYALASVAYAVAIAISLSGGPLAVALTLLPGLFGLLYSSKTLSAVHLRRLKEIVGVNTFVVSIAWTLPVTLLPLAFADVKISPAVIPVLAFLFLQTVIDVELPNSYDIESDRQNHVTTVAATLGIVGTRRFFYGLNLVTTAVVAAIIWWGLLPTLLAVALLPSIVYSTLVSSRLGRSSDPERLMLAREFEYLVMAACVVLWAGF